MTAPDYHELIRRLRELQGVRLAGPNRVGLLALACSERESGMFTGGVAVSLGSVHCDAAPTIETTNAWGSRSPGAVTNVAGFTATNGA